MTAFSEIWGGPGDGGYPDDDHDEDFDDRYYLASQFPKGDDNDGKLDYLPPREHDIRAFGRIVPDESTCAPQEDFNPEAYLQRDANGSVTGAIFPGFTHLTRSQLNRLAEAIAGRR